MLVFHSMHHFEESQLILKLISVYLYALKFCLVITTIHSLNKYLLCMYFVQTVVVI